MSYTPNQTGTQYSFYYTNGLFQFNSDNNLTKLFRGNMKSIKIISYSLIEFRIKTYNLTMPWCSLKPGKVFELDLVYDTIGLELEFRTETVGKIDLMMSGYVQDDIEYETTLQEFIDSWVQADKIEKEDLPQICI